MKYYLDTEFLEGTQKTLFGKTKPTIDLISIGIVCNDEREYYAISKDFNLKEAWNRHDLVVDKLFPIGPEYNKSYWIRNNILKPIFYEMYGKDINFHNIDSYFTYRNFKRLLNKYGKSNKQIAAEIEYFTIGEYTDIDGEKIISPDRPNIKGNPQFYAYYADYDWVVFCWLFGKMIDLPKGFPMYCIDLKQTLDEKEYVINNTDIYFSPLKIKDSESDNNDNITKRYVLKSHVHYPKQINEHNALADARWNKQLHKFLNKL